MTDIPMNEEPVQLRPHKQNHKGFVQNAAEWVGIVAGALVVAFFVRTYVVQTFYIPSASMEQTLLIDDHIIANKLAYTYGDIDRGDIVVFARPPAFNDPNTEHLVKRVIGLPGDTLESRQGIVYVNGEPLSEPYLEPGTVTTSLPLTRVPEGQYFMMGDNRSNSTDSRYALGMIERDLVLGRADVRIWPFSRFGAVD